MTPRYAARRRSDGAWLWAPVYANPKLAPTWSTRNDPYLFVHPDTAREATRYARPRPPAGQPPDEYDVVSVDLVVGAVVDL